MKCLIETIFIAQCYNTTIL